MKIYASVFRKAPLSPRLFGLALLILFALSACNNRENKLLPPDLVDTYYLTDNTITTYTNYLISCSNDDAYLYIPASSIADSLLNYDDIIVFEKRDNLLQRDSLAFQDGTTSLGNTYYFGIIRAGVSIQLSGTDFVQIYSDLLPANSSYRIGFSDYLFAENISPRYMGESRAWYPLSTTGEVAMVAFSDSTDPTLSFSSNSQTHALLYDSTRQCAFKFPTEYCATAGNITISLQDKLESAELESIQGVFPGFATSSIPIKIITANDTGTSLAYLRLREPGAIKWDRQWLKIADGRISTWDSGDTDNPNWSVVDSDTYSFLMGSGSYLFVNPISTQNTLNISLDGRYNQIYLPDLWLDLSNATLDAYAFRLDLAPDASQTISSYFSGNPYQLNGNHVAVSFSFTENSLPVKALPDGSFIEYGFNSALNTRNNLSLFTVYNGPTEDIVTYKTLSDTYDSEHYTVNSGWTYCSVAGSGIMLYANISQSNPYQIPCLKPSQYMQGDWGYVYWNDSAKKRSYSKLVLNTNPSGGMNHPWLQGEPLSLSQIRQLAEVQFFNGSTPIESVPANFLLKLLSTSTPNDILLLAPSNKLSVYQSSRKKAKGSYTYSNGIVEIAPVYGGKLISANYTLPNPATLRTFSNMAFMLPELYLYTGGSTTSTATLNVLRSSSLSDPYQLLGSQYNFTAGSLVHQLTASTDSYYTDFSPTMYFPRNRGNELVIYESTEDYYRFYPYSYSATPDPWHFWTDGHFIGIYPAFDGKYGLYTDNNPHQSIIGIMNNNTRDMVVSLYQAQFVMPQFYIGNPITIGSRFTLNKLSTVPGATNPLAAYQLLMSGPAGAALTPNFFNIPTSGIEPYIYIPIDNPDAIATARLFYRSTLGLVQELVRVNAFDASNWQNGYIVSGNSLVCNVNNPGWFYVLAR